MFVYNFLSVCLVWHLNPTTVFDEVMRAPIQLQCIFSYTILANPKVEPHAPNTSTFWWGNHGKSSLVALCVKPHTTAMLKVILI